MSYIGQGLPADTFQGFVTDSFTGDGSATTFTLSKEPFSEDTLIVVINNVIQKPTTNFTVSGTTLTIVGTAVASGDVIYAIHMGGPLPIGGAAELDLNGASDKLILDTDGDTTISADTDDQIDFKAGGTDIMSLTATTVTINDGTTITVADNTDNLTLTSTDADANAGPNLRLYRNSSSPADHDIVGQIDFEGRNDNSEDIVYAKIFGSPKDVSDSTEDGGFFINTMLAGSDVNRMGMSSSQTVFNDDSNDIDFRVETDSQTHGLFVDAGNNMVAVNNSTYDNAQFKVQQDTASRLMARFEHHASSGNVYGLRFEFKAQAPDNHTSDFLVAGDTTASRLFILADGDIQNHDNSYGAISDERIKQDIRDSNSQWDDIKAVKVRNYKKKDDVRQYGDKAWEQIGVIAQELEDAGMDKLIKESDPTFGDILSDSSFGTLYEDGDTIPEGKKIGDVKEVKQKVKGVSYSVLYMKAIKALQEAMAKIETLETKVKALEDA
jgi:hypothetical protein